jgi:hypothetical protein
MRSHSSGVRVEAIMKIYYAKLSHWPEIDSRTLWHRQRGWWRRTPGTFLFVIGPGGRKEHGLGPVLPLQPPLREDKGEGVGKGGVSECGRLLGM